MATKKELYNQLAKLQEENHLLRGQNEIMYSALLSIYTLSKRASGIEAAIVQREEERLNQPNKYQ